MTQDDVIEMAQEVGMDYLQFISLESMEKVIRFVNLVEIRAADKATEEANARANASWTLMCKKMVAFEREACAKVCDELSDKHTWEGSYADECAQAIRARGEQALAQPEQDGDCKKCKDGCPACDARKLQKEAHDLL